MPCSVSPQFPLSSSRCSFQPRFIKLCLNISNPNENCIHSMHCHRVLNCGRYYRLVSYTVHCLQSPLLLLLFLFFWKLHLFDGIANRKCVGSCCFFVDRNQETFDMLKCAFVSISMVKFCCIYLLLFQSILYLIGIRSG